MHQQAIIWSAAACPFPGAGVYLGLALDVEHLAVARALNPRQMRMFVGASIQIRPGSGPWPLIYYAVRDPSAVRVQPVATAPDGGGLRHVRLFFRFEPLHRRAVALASDFDHYSAGSAGFLLTVGLRPDLETEFFHATLGARPEQDWNDLFLRIRATSDILRDRDRLPE